MNAPANDNFGTGIAFIVFGMLCITINDTIIKQFSDRYPLHQMVFLRSLIGICFSFGLVLFEGGLRALRTSQPLLHLLRALCLVAANMLFFLALATSPLADVTALFFVAPLFITLLSIPILGEKVGIRRFAAVIVGFIGVLIMLRPGSASGGAEADRLTLLLPVAAAFAYSVMQILTRKLALDATASAMAIYTQGTFIIVGIGFWLIAGDGRFAEGLENPSWIFLLRAWAWPTWEEWPLILFLGLLSAGISYSLARAYRSADAASIAPFEYVAMPLAIFWGWLVFGDFPDAWVLAGSALIAGAGIYVFIRERQRARPNAARRPRGRA